MLDALKRLDLDDIVTVHEGDFRGMSSKPEPNSVPFDFVWFDCGGPAEYVRFLEEYWPLINPDGGILVLHFRYWDIAPNQKPERSRTDSLCLGSRARYDYRTAL